MNNLIEFALRMKDLASGQLKQFGATARTTFQQAEGYTKNLNNHNKTLGMSYNELQKKIKQVEDTIRNSTIPSQIAAARRELEMLQRQASKHSGNVKMPAGGGGGAMGGMGGMSSMAGMAGTAIAGAAVAGIYAAGELVIDGIQASFERQMVQTSFNVLTGSVNAGENLTKDLVDLQQQTILGAEVFQNAQTMMGFGFKDTEVLDNLKMLGDVSMGDTNKLSLLTLAFSQVKAAGKLTGQDLLQFINAGFNPLQQIAEKTGMTMAELKDKVSEGAISFEMVQQAFMDATSEGGRFDNMLEKIAETPAGKMQQLAGAWEEMKIKLGAAFQPLVAMALDLANKLLPMVEPFLKFVESNVQKVANVIGKIEIDTGGFADYIKIVKDMFADHLIPYAMKMFEFIGKTVGKFAEFVGKSELLKDAFSVIYGFVGGMYDVFGWFLHAISWYLDNFVLPMFELVDSIYTLVFGSSKGSTGGDGGGYWNDVLKQVDYTVNGASGGWIKDLWAKKDGKTDGGEGGTGDGSDIATQAEDSITGGGPKVVNIQVGKFLEEIVVNNISMKESAEDLEKMFMEMFARITVQGAAIV